MKTYDCLNGTTKVLISSPHVYNHYRRNINTVVKQGEPWTDYIARNIATTTNSYLISSNQILNYDPNYDLLENNPYKNEVMSIVKKEKVKCFIDIHGLHDNHSYDFAIYYPLRFIKSQKYAYDLAAKLSKGVLRDCLVMVLNMKDGKQETLSEFSTKKLHVPAIQVEIARYIREDDKLREGVITVLSEWIMNI